MASVASLGKPMTPSGLEMLFKRLEELAPGNAAEKAAILEQAVRKRWKDVYPLEKDAGQQKGARGKPNRFHNFDQGHTDYDAIMAQKLKERLEGGGDG